MSKQSCGLLLSVNLSLISFTQIASTVTFVFCILLHLFYRLLSGCRLDAAFCPRTVTSRPTCKNICESPGGGKRRTQPSRLPRAVVDEHERHPIRFLRQLCRGHPGLVRIVQLLLHNRWQVWLSCILFVLLKTVLSSLLLCCYCHLCDFFIRIPPGSCKMGLIHFLVRWHKTDIKTPKPVALFV